MIRYPVQVPGGAIVPTIWNSRQINTGADLPITTSDTVIFVNQTVAAPITLALPTITIGGVLLIKDMKGDATTNNITLDAGGGNLINGLQTLLIAGSYGAIRLIGMSATQWGTW